MEVTNMQVISRPIVKPSSSTNHHHLPNLKPSLFDQLAPPVYVPQILFYQAPDHHSHGQIFQNLKQSLSNTLSHFYPLAGKLDLGNYTVDCNDDGVELVEARVHATLSDVIQEDNMEQFEQYLPLDTSNGLGESLLAVQVSFFDCGGFAVGICLSHRVVDGASLTEFLNAWSAACRGILINNIDNQPPAAAATVGFDLSRHFPARDLSGSRITPSIVIPREKVVTKRFIFDREKLRALRQAATAPSRGGLLDSVVVKDPTRVELVTAFVWKSIMEIARFKAGTSKNTFIAVHAVNLRPRTDPRPSPLEHAFGNYYALTAAVADRLQDGGGAPEMQEVVRLLRSAIRKIDGEYTSDHGDRCLEDTAKLFELLSKEETEYCSFSSWCRFNMYEVDFGWGRPVWLGSATLPMVNLVLLHNTKCGDGIEVLVNLIEDNTERFEARYKLL